MLKQLMNTKIYIFIAVIIGLPLMGFMIGRGYYVLGPILILSQVPWFLEIIKRLEELT